MRHVVQAAELFSVKEKAGLVIGEGVWTIETSPLLGDEFPKVKILLRPAHLFRLAAPRVCAGREGEQPVVYQPREENDFVFRFGFLQEKRWAPVESNESRDFLARDQVAFQLAQLAPGNF